MKSLTFRSGSAGERDLRVFLDLLRPLRRASQTEHGLSGGADLQFEQALIDVADLLHVQGAEGEAAALAADDHVLDGAEHPQHGAVVHGGRPGRGGGRASVGAAFEPWIAVGVEQAAAVGGQPQVLVGDTGVDGAGDCEEPVPGGGSLAEHRAEAVGLLQLLDEVADAVGSDVEVVVAGQQAALLGEQQEHDPHHHRDDAGVEVVVADAGQERGVRFAVELVERRDEELDGLADLAAELLGDLFLAFEGFGEQGGELVLRLSGLETGAGEQGDEAFQGLWLLAEQGCVPDSGTGRGAARRGDESPPASVGDDPDRDVPGTEQHGQPLDGVRRPGAGRGPGQRMRSPGGDHAEQLPRPGAGAATARLGVVAFGVFVVLLLVIVGCVRQVGAVLIDGVRVLNRALGLVEVAEVRAERDAVVRDDLGEGLRHGVVDDEVLLPVEDVAQHVRDDRVPARAAVVHHLRDQRADGGALLDGHFRQPVGEDPV